LRKNAYINNITTKRANMFVIQMLNSANEWELCVYVFESYAQADEYAKEHFSMFEDYNVEELMAYGG
jgi:hypothetical protein